jgi:hypothetical protein
VRHRSALVAVAAVLALLTSACQLSLATDIGVAPDGSGTLELAVAVDEELGRLLADAGVDLTLGLEDADAVATDWEVEQTPRGDGREVRLRTSFEEPAELGALVAELHAGLTEDDPAILEDVVLAVDDDGRVTFRARAGLDLPTTAGASGTGVTFDAEDLEDVLARDGGSAVRYDLRLTLPGRPVEHDADARTWLLVGAAFAVSAAAAAVLVVLSRRRGRRLAGERAERVRS